MSSKLGTITVYIPEQEAAASLLSAAKTLTDRTGAALKALHVMPPIQIHADAAMAIGSDFTQTQIQLNRETADDTRLACVDSCRSLELECDWTEADAGARPLMSVVAAACRTSDLVIVPGADRSVPAMAMNDPAEIVLGCGRPALIVPRQAKAESLGRAVMIAWNGSRESARVAFDCLAIVEPDAHIRVVSIGDQASEDEPHRSGALLCESLARRGFDCEAVPAPAVNMSVGEKIRSLAEAWSIDLIAMGCYGHSRLRETIFGGTTREVLSQFSTPILMSH